MNIIKASDLQKENLRILLYGAAGAGKTEFIKQLPRPTLVLDFDKKEVPLMWEKDIDIVSYVVKNLDESSQIFIEFRRDFKEIKKQLIEGKYKSFVFDSLTSFDILALRHFLIQSGKPADSKPGINVYGDLNSFYKTLFSELKSLSCTVLINAHELIVRDKPDELGEQGEILAITPMITGDKTYQILPSMFQEVWYLEFDATKKERKIYFRNWRKRICTTGILKNSDGFVINPTWEKIMKEGN